ncbi:MAG: ABC transporter ATP-binding protein [Deltaproteobacteria bacterium]|nr:ABC transporter ATP-binding protein [Deltaproteobacteria bacterium]MBW1792878.1 ABC transporter ATP-binding protein [Deltaproteobacteria bacterium]MBW2330312.1 ABC transporter ATP-binding protein [Deltaproteobacteria bacterium]
MSQKKAVVEIAQVDFAYDGNLVLENITLTVEERDFLGVVGPNGSGKTTLLEIILGLIHPLSGKVRVFGRTPKWSRHLIGYIPQHADLDASFPISVMDVVLIGRLGKAPMLGRYRKSDRQAAEEAMRAAEIYDLRNRRFGALSGGQKQRVLMARALVGQPELLLLDEPTASIDGRVEQDIYELLKKLNETVTIVLVSHDLGFISTYVNRVACVNRRLVCNPTEHITGDVIEACYSGPVHMLKHKCEL